jgi:hypothetical protein
VCDCESALSTDHVLCKAEKMDLWSSYSQGLGWKGSPRARAVSVVSVMRSVR